MKDSYFIVLFVFMISSCSTSNQLLYMNDSKTKIYNILDYSDLNNLIEVGDILKIDVQTIVPEAALPYNILNSNPYSSPNDNILKLEGYLVDNFKMINFPVIGKISTLNLSIYDLEQLITKLLIDGNHLTNPSVKVRRVNSKFTVLGEVRIPGTFSYFDETLNIFQALGYAGDLTINGKRKNITLIREKGGLRTVYKIKLTKSDLLNKPYYYIKNNDVIIVEPNFSQIKSAGFIGSPASIASISSLILSITLLIINR